MLYAVILAGGSGTRLWPLSRKKSPKQTMAFAGGESLFQRTVKRLEGIVPPDRTYVITSTDLAEALSAQAPGIPRRNIVGESEGRDSAAAVVLGAFIIAQKEKDPAILMLPADHLITPVEKFQAAVKRAEASANAGDYLVTFGVVPTRVSTAYGYIERGERLAGASGAFAVKAFHEKPDAETAKKFVKDEAFFWNSGMFMWRASAILAAAQANAAEHVRVLRPAAAEFAKAGFGEALARAYKKLKKISIDYAVMEKAKNVVMVQADFEWNDVGSPVALLQSLEKDGAGNVALGLSQLVESKDCVVISGSERLLAVFGCEKIVAIQTPDATLVCPADRADDLKKLIAEMEKREGFSRFL
jgi:mannose-1-phosphate guanylyltransferase